MLPPKPNIKNFDKPYRGLPLELRRMIWQWAVPDEIAMSVSPSSTGLTMKPWAPSETYFVKLLLVNSEVRAEVQEVMKSKTVLEFGYYDEIIENVLDMDCEDSTEPHEFIDCLNSLPEQTRATINRVSICTGNYTVEYSWRKGKLHTEWDFYDNRFMDSYKKFPNANWVCGCGGLLWKNTVSVIASRWFN